MKEDPTEESPVLWTRHLNKDFARFKVRQVRSLTASNLSSVFDFTVSQRGGDSSFGASRGVREGSNCLLGMTKGPFALVLIDL